MLEKLAQNLGMLKQEFVKTYDGHSHIQELIPSHSSEFFPINETHLELLHRFVAKNPIYHNSYEKKIGGILCTVYEGDINEYWLNSIKHGSSCQPFYPTWVISAYIAVLIAKNFDYAELIDVGSGDGRITAGAGAEEPDQVSNAGPPIRNQIRQGLRDLPTRGVAHRAAF